MLFHFCFLMCPLSRSSFAFPPCSSSVSLSHTTRNNTYASSLFVLYLPRDFCIVTVLYYESIFLFLLLIFTYRIMVDFHETSFIELLINEICYIKTWTVRLINFVFWFLSIHYFVDDWSPRLWYQCKLSTRSLRFLSWLR